MNKEELIRSIMADRVISARNEEMKVHAYRDTAVVTYSGEIRLDKSRTGVDVDLTQHSVAGVNEAMRCLRRNDDDAARFHLALFISDLDGGAAFEGECDFDVRMLM